MKNEADKAYEAYIKLNEYVCQELGKALEYPWYKDDPKNFPDATEAHGVCVGELVAESLVDEAVQKIAYFRGLVECHRIASERQRRMIHAIREARDRFEARIEVLEELLGQK